jgi:hypothetical protein
MAARDELTAEERLILAFAEADFRIRRVNLALAMVQNPETKAADLRVVISVYRDQWRIRHQSTPIR